MMKMCLINTLNQKNLQIRLFLSHPPILLEFILYVFNDMKLYLKYFLVSDDKASHKQRHNCKRGCGGEKTSSCQRSFGLETACQPCPKHKYKHKIVLTTFICWCISCLDKPMHKHVDTLDDAQWKWCHMFRKTKANPYVPLPFVPHYRSYKQQHYISCNRSTSIGLIRDVIKIVQRNFMRSYPFSTRRCRHNSNLRKCHAEISFIIPRFKSHFSLHRQFRRKVSHPVA